MKKNIVIISIVLLVLTAFISLIVIDTKNIRKYWNNQMEIKKTDSINTNVNETRYLRGYLSFNRELFIDIGNVDEPNITSWKVTELELPFTLKKEANNDTIYIYTDDAVYYFVFTD